MEKTVNAMYQETKRKMGNGHLEFKKDTPGVS